MPKRVFDILPPLKKAISPIKPQKSSKRKFSSTAPIYVILMLLLGLIFWIYQGRFTNIPEQAISKKNTNNNFELFDKKGKSTLNDSQPVQKVAVSLAKGNVDEEILQKAKKAIQAAGYELTIDQKSTVTY